MAKAEIVLGELIYSGGDYELIDIPALTANSTYETEIFVDLRNIHFYAALVCPSSNETYVYGGLFEIEDLEAYSLKTNSGQQVKFIVQNGHLTVSTTIATAAGKALIVYI